MTSPVVLILISSEVTCRAISFVYMITIIKHKSHGMLINFLNKPNWSRDRDSTPGFTVAA